LKTSYSTGLQPLLKTILFRVFDFHGDADNAIALEAILFHLCNTCIHFGSLYEFCGKLTLQLTRNVRFQRIM